MRDVLEPVPRRDAGGPKTDHLAPEDAAHSIAPFGMPATPPSRGVGSLPQVQLHNETTNFARDARMRRSSREHG